MTRRMVLVRGPSGSGKSTLASALWDMHYSDGVLLSPDDFMVDVNGNYCFDPNRIPETHLRCQKAVFRAMLDRTPSVVIHAVGMRFDHAYPYLYYAHQFEYKIQIITVDAEFPNIHGVPDSTVQLQRERMESSSEWISRSRQLFEHGVRP